MNLRLDQSLTAIVCFLWSIGGLAAADSTVCAELSGYLVNDQSSKLSSPAREPEQNERQLIDKAKIELLETSDYAKGVFMVDADNDGKEDVFAWSIQGSGRFVYAALFDLPALQDAQAREPVPKVSMDLGVLDEPRFVRYNEINYIVSTDTGDRDGMFITRIVPAQAGGYEQQTVCRMQTTITPHKVCTHPACKKLRDVIENPSENGPFVNVEWPHKYFPPAGLEVYFSGDWSVGDFDNTGNPASIWRFGREGYINQHMYWALLGQGKEMPEFDSKLRPLSEDKTERRVLPGRQHDRLRRTLSQQSETLNKQLHRPVSLPNEGEFFLFKAHGNRTYWAWDFGEPPYGEEIHILYTNARKSDYIGAVRVTRQRALEPCTSNCTVSSDR